MPAHAEPQPGAAAPGIPHWQQQPQSAELLGGVQALRLLAPAFTTDSQGHRLVPRAVGSPRFQGPPPLAQGVPCTTATSQGNIFRLHPLFA